jgi:hypothetical protein
MKVKIDNPAFPEGHLLAIDGLGVFENGKEVEVNDEQVAAFEMATGKKFSEAFGNDPTIAINGKTGEPTGNGETTTEETEVTE